MFVDDRNQTLIDKSANSIAHHALFIREQVVDSIKVDTFEWHRSPPARNGIWDGAFHSFSRRGKISVANKRSYHNRMKPDAAKDFDAIQRCRLLSNRRLAHG